MALYSPLLDWLTWGLGIAGAVCSFWAGGTDRGPARGYRKLGAFVLFGLTLISGGWGGILANERAPRLEVRGVVRGVREYGIRNPTIGFTLDTTAGRAMFFTVLPSFTALANGESARVLYQGGMDRLIRVTVLDGPQAGATYVEDFDDVGLSKGVVAGGAILMVVGLAAWVFGKDRRRAQ